MSRILFWNIHRNAVDENLVRLVNLQQVDVLALAESDYPTDKLAAFLNDRIVPGTLKFEVVPGTRDGFRIPVLSRWRAANRRPPRPWEAAFTHSRYMGWTIHVSADSVLLFVVLHFPDARYEQGDGQRKTAIQLRYSIEQFEATFVENPDNRGKTLHSLLIGDFNASPFEGGIAGFYGLNASAHREIVEKHGSRFLGGQEVKFYYNPMWRFFGHPETPGTFYDRLSAPVSYDWFLLDQVLLSPSLLPFVTDDAVHILDRDGPEALGGIALMEQAEGRARRPKAAISDHLPLLLEIAL